MEEEMKDKDLRKRVPYHIQRDVLDELGVDQVAEKSDFKISAKEKLREAVRCVAFFDLNISLCEIVLLFCVFLQFVRAS